MTIITNTTESADEVRWEYSPIVHGRQGLLHPGPGVEGLRLQSWVVLDVAEHGHGGAGGLLLV